MAVDIEIIELSHSSQLTNVAEEVFDYDVSRELAAEFVEDHRHHMVIALDGNLVVGMCSGVHYVHPDKKAELWINEVGVARAYRGQGIGRRLVNAMLGIGQRLGISQAWVLTERSNLAAKRLYRAVEGSEEPEECVMYNFRIEQK